MITLICKQSQQMVQHWKQNAFDHIRKHIGPNLFGIFQICRGKFWTIFRENLGRVFPYPSTWHKHQEVREKILKKDPFSALLDVGFTNLQFLIVRMRNTVKID